ncbi:uncharacterized protein LOC127799165 isoform X1 [Diospyros lotus]|uniref:uncharacterized protein LOC127799165 isoform X1 n=1 Tax=Diospyros lotus TaxID=55363 RepID=UPI00225B0C46|nr:uncharacterized protein LOC127799165 isoform X1 [Diospyros lotus]
MFRGIEICNIPVQFPATSSRFGDIIPRHPVHRRNPKTSFFLRGTAAENSNLTDASASEFPNRMFIMGMGFVGQYFAEELRNRGWTVCGSCTNHVKKKKFEEMGFDVHLFDANEPEVEILNVLNHHSHLLVTIPPLVGIGDPLLQYEELVKSTLMVGNLKWLCYLSSTGVYGNCGGAWVDEDYPASPTDEKARARLAAEEGWLKLGYGLGISTQIFRLGGIYGPGRSAVDTIIKREPLSKMQRIRASRQYTSRVHVADICQALWASIYKPCQGKIYNVVDDEPAPRLRVFSYAWDLVDRKWPGHLDQTAFPRTEKWISDETHSRAEKRVSNARIKEELGIRLLHPDYKSGLKSIIDHMDDPFCRLNLS